MRTVAKQDHDRTHGPAWCGVRARFEVLPIWHAAAFATDSVEENCHHQHCSSPRSALKSHTCSSGPTLVCSRTSADSIHPGGLGRAAGLRDYALAN